MSKVVDAFTTSKNTILCAHHFLHSKIIHRRFDWVCVPELKNAWRTNTESVGSRSYFRTFNSSSSTAKVMWSAIKQNGLFRSLFSFWVIYCLSKWHRRKRNETKKTKNKNSNLWIHFSRFSFLCADRFARFAVNLIACKRLQRLKRLRTNFLFAVFCSRTKSERREIRRLMSIYSALLSSSSSSRALPFAHFIVSFNFFGSLLSDTTNEFLFFLSYLRRKQHETLRDRKTLG